MAAIMIYRGLGGGEVPGRFSATKDEQPKGKPVPLPHDEPGGLSGPAPLPKR